MSRKIECGDCHKDMGEIRDATLRKGVVHICTPCNNARGDVKRRLTALELMQKTQGYNDPTKGMFDDVFGDIFGKR